ncbi:CASP8 and FADD-like apoptosis regulator [Anarhichas minor]|uniref:CASP8 and FADD-like apoptosis regulator n=1 Tax=Anarhichas minor TaxID=65739 RepID=UPI003F741E53
MALPDQLHLQAINQTAEALSSCERRRLFYLCDILDTDNSVARVKDMLTSKVMCHEMGLLFLTELMLQLSRFDILRKVFKTSRDEVENALKQRRVLPRFRVLMANINEDMDSEDLNSVKFLLGSTLPREKMEKAQSFLDVIIELEKLDIVSPERVDFVEECFKNIGRVDLARKVSAYKMSVGTSGGHSSLQQRHRAPCPFPTPNGSHSLQQTRQAQPLHIVGTSGGHSSLQQRHRAPCPFPTPNGSHSLQQTRQAQPLHIVGTSGGHSSLQQRHRAPCPFPTPNGSHSLQQTRQAQPLHIEHIPVPVYREQSQLDCYRFNTNPRGVCVIIDCVGNDGDMLEQTFKALHFNVVLHKWLCVADTLSVLRGIFGQRENLECDGFVCCIISRGTASHLLGTDAYAAGLHLNDVRRLFNADECRMLAGKPKLFFIQRYSVPEIPPRARTEHRDEDLETDGCDGPSKCAFIPTDADVFWSHCWTDERQLEQGHHRSIYLKALTDTLRKGQRRKTHLVDVHTEVNGAIFEHNNRNPGAHYHIDLKHTLRKELYLK